MTHATLDNPADLIANVAKTILLADAPAFPFTPYGHRYLGTMANNRVEITATGFRRSSDHVDYANIANVQTPFYSHHTGQLAFTVVGMRTDQQNTDNFAYCVGRIGYLCRRDAQKFTPTAMSGLQVLDIIDLGATASEDPKIDADRSTRLFEISYQIPASVYAAAT